MTADELTAEETTAIALRDPAAGGELPEDEDLKDDDLEGDGDDLGDEDEDDGPDDPAEQAALWREAAEEARAERARILAEAEERKRAVDQEAWSESQRLDREAGEADATAAGWQAVADRAAEIARLEAQAASLQERRDSLLAEQAALTAEEDQLGARLAEFAAAREEARQRLAGAPGIKDTGESIAAAKDAMANLQAVEQAQAPSAARLQQVRARLAEIRGNEVQRDPWGSWRGPATGLPALDEDLARLGERLKALRREHAGLPPEGQAAQIAMRLLAEAPLPEGTPEGKGEMARILALGKVTQDMERLAQEKPDEYAVLRRRYLEPRPAKPERQPTMAEVLGLGPQQQPVPVQLPDGGWGVGFRVPDLPLPGGAVTGGR